MYLKNVKVKVQSCAVTVFLSCRYRTTGLRKMCEFCCFSLSFSNDGSVLAIASSYMYEHEEVPDNIPEDAIYVRYDFQQCCGSGSGIRCFFDSWSEIRDSFFGILDTGWDQQPIFLRA